MRLFFALQPSVNDCLLIDDWRNRAFPPLSHPVPAQNLHITLAFLGDVRAAQREQLEDAAIRLISPPLAVDLDQLGYFPRPGVLWVGPMEPPPPLMALAKALDSAARRVGVSYHALASWPLA